MLFLLHNASLSGVGEATRFVKPADHQVWAARDRGSCRVLLLSVIEDDMALEREAIVEVVVVRCGQDGREVDAR